MNEMIANNQRSDSLDLRIMVECIRLLAIAVVIGTSMVSSTQFFIVESAVLDGR
jgi:hypothetical protein